MTNLSAFRHRSLTAILLPLVLLSACFLVESEEIPLAATATDVPREHASPAILYVRPDGGTAAQCTGLVDAPWQEGGGSDCAWQHPFIALPPDAPPRLYPGDTLIIAPGSYMMGYGAPGSDACDTDYPWDCHMTSVPSGIDAQHPTRILGAGWAAGCPAAPELWGTERTTTILSLEGSNHVEIACLEITDHAGCAEDHSGGMACKKNRYPYGEWAYDGINASDSTDVILRDLNIHGLASAGIRAGRLTDWSVERVNLTANGWVGWEGDIDGSDENSGTLTFRNWLVDWNGCVEPYPEEPPTGCWAQTAGGYGDGIGTGVTGGHWVIEDSAFLHNTSDGLDLLYVRADPSSITIRRTIAADNAGNQIKTNGPTLIENSVVIGNCGFFVGQSFTHQVDECRAAGNAISFYLQRGDQVTMHNNSVASEGDCLVIAECDIEHSVCDGSERVVMRNNLFAGFHDFVSSDELTCLTYSENITEQVFDMDYSLIYNTKSTPPCPGSHDLCEVSPGVLINAIDAFDGRLLESSPAVGQADPANAPAEDFTRRQRDSSPDIGAYEWVAPVSWAYLSAVYASGE